VVCIREIGDEHRGLVGKPEGKRQLGRNKSIWESNIKMDIEEIGRGIGLD
jgi:hypothetical protein